jgi:hypothetical protein
LEEVIEVGFKAAEVRAEAELVLGLTGQGLKSGLM